MIKVRAHVLIELVPVKRFLMTAKWAWRHGGMDGMEAWRHGGMDGMDGRGVRTRQTSNDVKQVLFIKDRLDRWKKMIKLKRLKLSDLLND